MIDESWCPEEDGVLQSLYPDYRELRRYIPWRSFYSIRRRAERLGIQRKRRRWLASELTLIKRERAEGKTFRQIAAEHFPGVDVGVVSSRGSAVTTALIPPLKKLGIPVIDEIRAKARQRKMTLSQLDEHCCSGTYFQRNSTHLKMRWVAAAVELLGGELDVAWRD